MLNGPSTKKIYLYSFLTLGFYFLYWCSRSRADINRAARREIIPSTWLLILPGGNFWWMWQYSHALEHVSFNRVKANDTFLLYVIALSAWFLFGSAFNFFLPSDSSPINSHMLLIIFVVFLCVFAVAEIIGLAFFCATMQKKIKAITAHLPVSPIK